MCVSFKVQGPVKPVYKPKSKFDTEDEPLLRENPHRFVLLPIQYKDIWDMYKKAEGKLETRKCASNTNPCFNAHDFDFKLMIA